MFMCPLASAHSAGTVSRRHGPASSRILSRASEGGFKLLRYFVMTVPVDAFTTAAKPNFEFPNTTYQTGAGNRAAAPSEKLTGFAAFSGFLSQSPALAAA